MSWRYSDYICVDQDFTSSYIPSLDNPSKWRGFIPHDAFTNLLDAAISALRDKKYPPWVQGAYGTGKTHAAFALKHILEDPIDTVRSYFQPHHSTLGRIEGRWKALRDQGDLLVVYHEGTSNLGGAGARLFFAQFQQQVSEALKAKKLRPGTLTSIREDILGLIDGPHSSLNWPNMFKKHIKEFTDYETADDVLTKLREQDTPVLTDTIARVLEREKVFLLDTPQKIIDWVKSIIEVNSLGGLVFIWDEFTNYFHYTKDLTSLQALAEGCVGSHFVFMPITHRSHEQVGLGKDDAKKIGDRFQHVQLAMPNITAYKLLGNSIRIVEGRKEEWEGWREQIFSSVINLMGGIQAFGDVNQEELKRLIPFHPYTAYLLARISNLFASAQRTLFGFIAPEEGRDSPFQRFLREYPRGEEYWLTPGALMDFFFLEPRQGQDPIDLKVSSSVLTYFKAREDRLESPESKEVFRAISLLQILLNEHHVEESAQPRRSALRAAYRGAMLPEKLEAALTELEEKRVVTALAHGQDREYLPPDAQINHDMLEKFRKAMEQQSLGQCLEFINGKKLVLEKFQLHGEQEKHRVVPVIVDSKEFGVRHQNVIPQSNPHQVPVVLVICATDDELADARTKCCTMINASGVNAILTLVDTPLGSERLGELRENLAYKRYYEDIRDYNHTKHYEQRSTNLLTLWISQLAIGNISVFHSLESSTVSTALQWSHKVNELLRRVFDRGLWNISPDTVHLAGRTGSGSAEIALGRKPVNSRTEQIMNMMNNINTLSADVPCRSIKQAIDDACNKSGDVKLHRLWSMLNKPPYGLYNSVASQIVVTVFLKEYIGKRHYFDGTRSNPLNEDLLIGLSTLLVQGNIPDIASLRRLSKEEEIFCDLAQEITSSSPEVCRYPDEAHRALCTWLMESIGHPLFSLRGLVDEGGQNPLVNLTEAIDALETLLRLPGTQSKSLEIIKLAQCLRAQASKDELLSLLKQPFFEQGFRKMINDVDPELAHTMDRLKLTTKWAVGQLRDLQAEDLRFWEQKKALGYLPNLRADSLMIEAINGYFGIHKLDLSELRLKFINEMRGKNTPGCVIITANSHLQPILETLNLFLEGQQPLDVSTQSRLAGSITTLRADLRLHLDNPIKQFASWCEQHAQITLDQKDIQHFLDTHPQIGWQTDKDELLASIRQFIINQSHTRLKQELRQLFEDTLGFSSPSDWSQAMGVPLPLVWNISNGESILAALDQKRQPSQTELEMAVETFSLEMDNIKRYGESQFARNRMLEILTPELSVLASDTDLMEELHAHLLKMLGDDVLGWMTDLTRFSMTLRAWGLEVYHERIRQEVINFVAKISAGKSQELLAKMVEDTACGLFIHRWSQK